MKNVIDVMNNINTNELDLFFANTEADFYATAEIKETKIDHAWLNVLESTLTNLDKIIRSPRKFIVEEEEVEIVEKIKRVSRETIKHLAEHSENIQDINEDDETLVEGFGEEAVKPIADVATVVPDGADAREPDNHEDAGDIDWQGDAVVFAAEDFDCQIN